MNYGGQPSSSNATQLLAVNSAQAGRSVVLCDTTGQTEKEIKDKPTHDSSDLPIKSIDKNISVMSGAHGALFFTSKTLIQQLKS